MTNKPSDIPEDQVIKLSGESKVGFIDCKCDWHRYMLGDGCEICNPGFELIEDTDNE